MAILQDRVEIQEERPTQFPKTNHFVSLLGVNQTNSSRTDSEIKIGKNTTNTATKVTITLPISPETEAVLSDFQQINDRSQGNGRPNIWLYRGLCQPIRLLQAATPGELDHNLLRYFHALNYGVRNNPFHHESQITHHPPMVSQYGILHTQFSEESSYGESPYKMEFTYEQPGNASENSLVAFPTVRYFIESSDTARICAVQQTYISGIESSKEHLQSKIADLGNSVFTFIIENHLQEKLSTGQSFLNAITSLYLIEPVPFPGNIMHQFQLRLTPYQFQTLTELNNLLEKFNRMKEYDDIKKILTAEYMRSYRKSKGSPPAHVISLVLAINILHQQGIRHIKFPTQLPLVVHIPFKNSRETLEQATIRNYEYIANQLNKLTQEITAQIPGAILKYSENEQMLHLKLPEDLTYRNIMLEDLRKLQYN